MHEFVVPGIAPEIPDELDREEFVDIFLWNLAGPIDLVGIDVFAQILFEIGQKFPSSLAIFRALFRPRVNPIKVVATDEKVARETAALIERIA